MKRLFLYAIIAVALATASCSHDSSDKITFESYEAINFWVYEATPNDTDVVYADSVSMMMPVAIYDYDISALRDTILSRAFGYTNIPLAEAAEKWMSANAKDNGCTDKPIATNGQYDPAGFDYVSGFVANLQPDILVYCIRQEGYENGAAHGLTTRRYINFALKNGGHILTLSDIFTEEGLAELPARIAEQAQALSDRIGPTTIDSLPDDGNFYISSEDEIVFAYQPYEVSSYAERTIDIPFDPYELVEYMTPKGIHMFHLEDLAD